MTQLASQMLSTVVDPICQNLTAVSVSCTPTVLPVAKPTAHHSISEKRPTKGRETITAFAPVWHEPHIERTSGGAAGWVAGAGAGLGWAAWTGGGAMGGCSI